MFLRAGTERRIQRDKMNIDELVREIADQRGEIAEAAQNARNSFDKVSAILLEELGDVKITNEDGIPTVNIPESVERKYLLYELIINYAQGPDSLKIFAKEENIPYEEIAKILKYLELKSDE